jgi:hypothetical protein
LQSSASNTVGTGNDKPFHERYPSEWGPLDLEAIDIESSFPDSHVDGVPQAKWFISENFGKRALVEELVRFIERNDGPSWSSRMTPKGRVYTPTAIGSFCESRLALLADIDSHTFATQVRYSERFHVFVEACEEARRAGLRRRERAHRLHPRKDPGA